MVLHGRTWTWRKQHWWFCVRAPPVHQWFHGGRQLQGPESRQPVDRWRRSDFDRMDIGWTSTGWAPHQPSLSHLGNDSFTRRRVDEHRTATGQGRCIHRGNGARSEQRQSDDDVHRLWQGSSGFPESGARQRVANDGRRTNSASAPAWGTSMAMVTSREGLKQS
jgi:hypothetical protein